MGKFTDINQGIVFTWCILWQAFDITKIMQFSEIVVIQKLEGQIRLETRYTGNSPNLYLLLHIIGKFGELDILRHPGIGKLQYHTGQGL